MARISELVVYPVKGLRGINRKASLIEKRGLRHDRRWMLVDETGRFLSQRNTPRMCLFHPSLDGDNLAVQAPNGDVLHVPPPTDEHIEVRVWRSTCSAVRVGADTDAWFSEHLGVPATFVYMPDDCLRSTNEQYSQAGDIVGFADAFPILVASYASLADLNARLETEIPMNRFRANLIVEGVEAYEEDEWSRIEMGDIQLRAAKRCGRCSVTTTNQDTAEVGTEPLRTLAEYRREGNVVYFGNYFIPETVGEIRVGDAIQTYAPAPL